MPGLSSADDVDGVGVTAPASWTLTLVRARPRPARDRRMVQATHVPTLICVCGATATSLETAAIHQRDHHPTGE